jgi:hypothetical protein
LHTRITIDVEPLREATEHQIALLMSYYCFLSIYSVYSTGSLRNSAFHVTDQHCSIQRHLQAECNFSKKYFIKNVPHVFPNSFQTWCSLPPVHFLGRCMKSGKSNENSKWKPYKIPISSNCNPLCEDFMCKVCSLMTSR